MCERPTPGARGVAGTCVHCGADFHLGLEAEAPAAGPAAPSEAPVPGRRRTSHALTQAGLSLMGVAASIASLEVSARRSVLARQEADALFVCSPFLRFLLLGWVGRRSSDLVLAMTAGASLLTTGLYALLGFDLSEMMAMLQVLWTLVLLAAAVAAGAIALGTTVVRGGRR